jgi:hypothetical protein
MYHCTDNYFTSFTNQVQLKSKSLSQSVSLNSDVKLQMFTTFTLQTKSNEQESYFNDT